MKRIKYLTLLLAALICSTTITAQGIKIYQKNGTTLDLSYTEIDSIVAYGNNNTNDDKHEAVDLGLSVKWATCNVGAESPEEYGDYFAWGETTTKSEYTYENSKTYGKNIGDIAGDPAYDAATANWGYGWRLPTRAECEELIEYCTLEYTTLGDKHGFKLTSKINGNSIFLPAAGHIFGTSPAQFRTECVYWSSTPDLRGDTHPSEIDTKYASSIFIHSMGGGDSCGYSASSPSYRFGGFSIRPVTK